MGRPARSFVDIHRLPSRLVPGQYRAFVFWECVVMSFSELELIEPLLRAVREEGYHTATPIQLDAIPAVLAGNDLVGCAQTGTGKTAAFALPTLQRLSAAGSRPPARGRRTRCLVLSPTRELACQIGESFRAYGRYTGLRHTVIYGGVGQGPQVRALDQGVDIIVATPGRLLDLMNQGYVNLNHIEILILDEADQMFDMGFIHDLRRIVAKVPRERQTLLFSATMPPEIRTMAQQWLRNPVSVQVAVEGTPAELVEQGVYFVQKRDKAQLLAQCLKEEGVGRTLVFSKTKHGADKLVKGLAFAGIPAEAIHGNKSQAQRQRALAAFKSPKPPVLVATDIAARGLDIDSVTHVFNFDLPMVPETYIHRIGRTGRAGATGIAITLCDSEERDMLRQIERLTRKRLTLLKSQFDASRGAEFSDRASAGPSGESRSPQQRPAGQSRGPGGPRGGGARGNGAQRGGQRYGSQRYASQGRDERPRPEVAARTAEQRLAYGSKRFSKKPRTAGVPAAQAGGQQQQARPQVAGSRDGVEVTLPQEGQRRIRSRRKQYDRA